MDSVRQNKISRLIQKELSTLFQLEGKSFAAGAMVSVTSVRVSPDLSYAKIYVSIFPSAALDSTVKSLDDNNKNIRYMLGKRIGKQVRIIPELRFFVDDSLDYIEKIDQLLK